MIRWPQKTGMIDGGNTLEKNQKGPYFISDVRSDLTELISSEPGGITKFFGLLPSPYEAFADDMQSN